MKNKEIVNRYVGDIVQKNDPSLKYKIIERDHNNFVFLGLYHSMLLGVYIGLLFVSLILFYDKNEIYYFYLSIFLLGPISFFTYITIRNYYALKW